MFFRLFILATASIGATAMAAPPQLYRHAGYESPVHGGPDDLLLLAGDGLATDDVVVYRALADTNQPVAVPTEVPVQSDANTGVAPIVSIDGAPLALTVKLPLQLRREQSYALWVRNDAGEWSKAVKINDARPLWASPGQVYASRNPANLPRELKIVGRNIEPAEGHVTELRLLGPQNISQVALSDATTAGEISGYVARFALPKHLVPGTYRIRLSRDGVSWVDLPDQRLEVLPDPETPTQFALMDPRFGRCLPDDGLDDTTCFLSAVAAAAQAGGGTVYVGPGTWDFVHGTQTGVLAGEGILVPPKVQLVGAGSGVTRVIRHAEWSAARPTPAFTLTGHNLVTGLTFADSQVYRAGDRVGAFLQLGENFSNVAPQPSAATVDDIVITRNVFDKTDVAIGGGGLPLSRLFITYDTFGAYNSSLELSGDQMNVRQRYRLDDAVIDYNTFKPGSKLDLKEKSGVIASEIGAGQRVDFSGNTADGTSTEFLYDVNDARGWRAAFFWNLNDSIEETLVSQNTATCTGDKIGDGEALAFDNNTNTFAFATLPTVLHATPSSVTVSAPMAAQQHGLTIGDRYYVGHWIQIVSGPGLGEARRITGYSTQPGTQATTFNIAPEWDVVPSAGRTRIGVGREYRQVYVLDNKIDNRRPLCQKSNRSRRAAGSIVMWAQSVDSVIAANHQYDSDGIFVQAVYVVAEHACPNCSMESYFHSFLEIDHNVVDGEYDWDTDCSSSGIMVGLGAAPWNDPVPPTAAFGVSLSYNAVRRADGLHGGAIGSMDSWAAGPEPHRWPLSDNLLIHHNVISEMDGHRSLPVCGTGRPRMGIAFPDYPIAWHTVLYANTCKSVPVPVGPGDVDTVRVCPSSAGDACECPGNTH